MQDFLTVAQAAAELGLTPQALHNAVTRGRLAVVPLDGRTSLIPRAEVERYRREHLGRRGKRTQPDNLTKQQAYQQAYYQRRKAARQQEQQPATEPTEEVR